MKRIHINVGNKPIGKALTWAYPDGHKFGTFSISTYELSVSGKNNNNQAVSKSFEILRFGLKCNKGETPKVVGLADHQIHIIKAWLPHYTVHSARSKEKGAWQVYDNFLIHDGPDDPKKEVYASVGCLEICNGPQGFDRFNDFIISLSGLNYSTREKNLVEIGYAKNILITYQKATRPVFEKVVN